MTLGIGRRLFRAFTLFELLIVLAIIAIFTGVFVLRFDDGSTEEALAQASQELKSTALKAKKRAYAYRLNQYIVFSSGAYTLTEHPPVGERDDWGDRSNVANETHRIPPGVDMELYPSRAVTRSNARIVVWVFRASGLNDPLAVRFTKERSYMRLTFNVLTALAEEETFIE